MGARGLRGDSSCSAISAFVMPSATSRATSNSRAVSGRHGSSIEPRPRLARASSSARAWSGALPSRLGGLTNVSDQRRPRRRSGSSGSGTPRGPGGPMWPPRSGPGRPSRGPLARAPRARRTTDPVARRTSPSAWLERRSATGSQPARCSRARPTQPLGVLRAFGLRGNAAGAGHDERNEQRPLAGLTRDADRLLAPGDGAVRRRRRRGRSRPGPRAASG